ncbi:MAG TPA: nuclear transport factor 2 family protein [Acidimicrobiales bacterium]|nr:nuclear transport factor 2 family protein [Acidimicrobiales bacterium]
MPPLGMFNRMSDRRREDLLRKAYSLFNDHDVDGLLAMMTDDVEWPDVANGAVLRDKAAVRSYWEGQFAVASTRVEATEFVPAEEDLVAVVDQQIFDLQGKPLTPPGVVFHRYTFDGNLVCRMVVHSSLIEATRATET